MQKLLKCSQICIFYYLQMPYLQSFFVQIRFCVQFSFLPLHLKSEISVERSTWPEIQRLCGLFHCVFSWSIYRGVTARRTHVLLDKEAD